MPMLHATVSCINHLLSQEANLDRKVHLINELRKAIHAHSPFAKHPVDCVMWVPSTLVKANDYNPNAVAPPEMELLHHSIAEDGYTQPIVAWDEKDHITVIDGFHRHRVGKEYEDVRNSIHDHLPIVLINDDHSDLNHRMASTIRHNRARGKHKVEAMSDIVLELKRRNWTNDRICRELGMDTDEVLRLCQISGLESMFNDDGFSKAWEADGFIAETDFVEVTDTFDDDGEFNRNPNTNDPNRVFHTYDKWECYPAGFYENVSGKKKEAGEELYGKFLSDSTAFSAGIQRLFKEWPNSCEHYLTNSAMNRIAWLGQAAMCVCHGVPSCCCSGFSKMTKEQQDAANIVAYSHLCLWLKERNMPVVTFEEAYSGRQSDIY